MKERAKKKVGISVAKSFGLAFKDGSKQTRLSFVFMGFGQIARGQICKGIAYMATQALFILYMIFFGGGYIRQLSERT